MCIPCLALVFHIAFTIWFGGDDTRQVILFPNSAVSLRALGVGAYTKMFQDHRVRTEHENILSANSCTHGAPSSAGYFTFNDDGSWARLLLISGLTVSYLGMQECLPEFFFQLNKQAAWFVKSLPPTEGISSRASQTRAMKLFANAMLVWSRV